MMKRKNRLFAFLTALCLLAGLAVVPAAAAQVELYATASELQAEAELKKQAWDSAEAAAKTAEAALSDAKSSVETQKSAYDAVKAQVDAQQSICDNLPPLSETSTDDEKAADETARNRLTELQAQLATAQADLNAAEQAADLSSKEADATAARAAADQAKRDYDSAKAAADQAAEAEKTPTVVPPSSSTFALSDSTYNFGKLEKNASGSSLSRTITVYNRSTSPMTVSHSVSSGSGFSISGLPATVSAESSKTFTVTLSSTSSVTSYAENFTLTADYGSGNAYSRVLSVSAEVVETGYSLSVDPTSKDLGKLKEGYSESNAKDLGITVTLQNKGASSVRMNGFKGNDHFTVTANDSGSVTLTTGDKTTYKIYPKQDLKQGTYTDTITFQTNEGATVQTKVTVVVEKQVANLTTDPTVLDFGTAEVGYSAVAAKTVTIKNNTDYAMHLVQPYSYSYNISTLTQTSLPAGGTTTITVAPRTGLAQGAYSGAIEILSNGDSASLTVAFTVTPKTGASSFPDVAANSTFAADIAYVSQTGLMGGKSDGTFKPQESITRGQLVTILYRLEGQPFVSGTGFSDVAVGSYCERATKWAAATGVTTGNADGTFKPDDPISRQQLATFLYRYGRYKGYFFLSYADLSTFSDAGAVASYARDALSWANGGGLINGTSDGRLNPTGTATRGQSAAILHRFCVSIGK